MAIAVTREEEQLAGICGLYCGDCPFYLAARLGDDAQVATLSRQTGLPVGELKCDGCLSNNVVPGCRECKHGFRGCAQGHRVTWCFECSEFPCERLRDFSRQHVVNGICHHAKVIEDLMFMRDSGVLQWIAGQEHRSDCPSCGRPGYWFSRQCTACGADIR